MPNIDRKEFSYSGIDGYAEIMGWHIIVFIEGKDDYVSAINFDEILSMPNTELMKTANNILQTIEFPIMFGDKFSVVKNIYGNPCSSDTILTDITRYHYFLENNSLYLCFGIENKDSSFCSLEIISNSNIIKSKCELLNCEKFAVQSNC